MKKFTIYLTAVLLLVAVSCVKDRTVTRNAGKPIDFHIAIDTRAADNVVSEENIESFHVAAFDQNGATYFGATEYSDADGDGYFTSDDYYYWPPSGSLDFYAISPYSETLGCTLSEDAKKLTDYSPASEFGAQSDIITAKAVGKTYSADDVLLEFNHIMSQIEVRVKNTNVGYTYSIKGVKIANVLQSGTYDFDNDGWTPGTVKTTYSAVHDSPIVAGSESQSVMGASNAMLIPQQLTAWDKSVAAASAGQTGSYLALYLNIVTSSGAAVYPEDGGYDWVAVPIWHLWEPGYRYVYVIDLSNGAGLDEDTNSTILGDAISFELHLVWDWYNITQEDVEM